MDTHIDGARRLLVVDDEPVQCLIVTEAMAALGFAADSATSLEEATGRIAQHAYDVIVLDLSLGGREGLSLLRLIATNPGDPVVILMSRLDESVRAASARFAVALGLRVAGALAKPVGPSALRARAGQSTAARGAGGPHGVPPTADELGARWNSDIVAAFQPR